MKEANYRLTSESNNIEMILNHLCRICNTTLPRLARAQGDPDYKAINWPDDYRDNHYSLEKYMADLVTGRKLVLEGVEDLTDAQLEELVQTWGGTDTRKVKLIDFIGELIHHRGQIAYIRGTVKRLRAKDPDFLARAH